nr:hypothetical protein [Tanacetum cinerariifolium]
VVVPKLHKHEVAGLDFCPHRVPQALGLVGAAAGAAQRVVFHPNARGVEVRGQVAAPAPEAAVALALAIFYGRVANEKQRRLAPG